MEADTVRRDSGMAADTVGRLTICPFAYLFGGNLSIRTKNLKILCFFRFFLFLTKKIAPRW
jgi:hypothetical protein